MKEGDWVKINGPYGDFTYAGEKVKIGALTGGIGITPLRSICKYCVDKKLPTSIIMLYSNKTENEIVFKDQLEEMSGTGLEYYHQERVDAGAGLERAKRPRRWRYDKGADTGL